MDRHDKSPYRPSPHPLSNKVARSLWRIAYLTLFRPSPRLLHRWRILLLKAFGAHIGKGSVVYSSVKIWAPWNLTMGDYSALSHDVDCYCVDKIIIGNHCTISQYSFLCTGSHDYNLPERPLITAPITIHDYAWIAADVFVAPGVTIENGAIIGARSTVVKDVQQFCVVAGNPAKVIKKLMQHSTSHTPA